jgi:hypothetical protein
LIAAAVAWSEWPAFVDAARANLSASEGRPVGEGLVGLVGDLLPLFVVLVPAALGAGLYACWRRLGKVAVARPLASRG